MACRHVYLRRLAVIPAPAYDPPWHLRPSCVLTCAASARSRPTEAPRWSTPIVVRVTHAIKENDGAYVKDMVALRGRDARGSCLDRRWGNHRLAGASSVPTTSWAMGKCQYARDYRDASERRGGIEPRGRTGACCPSLPSPPLDWLEPQPPELVCGSRASLLFSP